MKNFIFKFDDAWEVLKLAGWVLAAVFVAGTTFPDKMSLFNAFFAKNAEASSAGCKTTAEQEKEQNMTLASLTRDGEHSLGAFEEFKKNNDSDHARIEGKLDTVITLMRNGR